MVGNITETPHIGVVRLREEAQLRYNPLRNLTPQKITAAMDAFERGNLSDAAKIYDAIRRRDATVQACVQKRKRATSRLGWSIVEQGSDDAASAAHAEFLEDFFNNITVTSAADANKRGSVSMLIENILSALENKYAVSEIIWRPESAPRLSAEIRHVPLWYFENTQGFLRFKRSSFDTDGVELEKDGWLAAVADSALMEATAICYIIKRFALGDWAAGSQRFGMPTPVYNSTAQRGTPEYQSALETLAGIMNGCGIVTAAGETFDLKLPNGASEPFKTLTEAMDRYIAVIWRGSDLSTLSADNAAGASLQGDESEILEDADCALVEETIEQYLTIPALRWRFGNVPPAAYFQLTRKNRKDKINQIAVYRGAAQLGCAVSKRDVYEALELREPEQGEPTVELAESAASGMPAFANETLQDRPVALAKANAEDIRPLLDEFTALEKITDASEYADALAALEKKVFALYNGGKNEAAAMLDFLKNEPQ